jgi:hypothetical protein
MLRRTMIIRRAISSKPDLSPDDRWRIPMKTMILAAVATLSLSVGAAYAQGVPAGYQGAPHYGTQSSANG